MSTNTSRDLTSSWADQQVAGTEQRVGGTKQLIKSAVIWVRPELPIGVLHLPLSDTSHANTHCSTLSVHRRSIL